MLVMEMNSACMEIRVIKNVKMITPGDSFVKVRGRNLIARVLVQDFNVCLLFKLQDSSCEEDDDLA